jgi:hypothetical protein
VTSETKVGKGRTVDYELEGLPPGSTVQVVDQVVYIRHVGEVPFKVSFGVVQRVAEDPQIQPGWPAVINLLELILPKPSTEDIRTFVNDMGALKEQFSGKFAIVTDNTLYYGFARMISMLSEFHAIKMSVFRDLESAEQFIRSE